MRKCFGTRILVTVGKAGHSFEENDWHRCTGRSWKQKWTSCKVKFHHVSTAIRLAIENPFNNISGIPIIYPCWLLILFRQFNPRMIERIKSFATLESQVSSPRRSRSYTGWRTWFFGGAIADSRIPKNWDRPEVPTAETQTADQGDWWRLTDGVLAWEWEACDHAGSDLEAVLKHKVCRRFLHR